MREAWQRTTLGAVAKRLANGGTPPTQIEAFWNGTIPWITGADFTSRGVEEFRRFVSEVAVRQTSTNVIQRGQLLLVTRTGVGKLALAPCDIAISQDITGLYVDETKADPRFLFHRMRIGVQDLKKLNQGTSINGIIRSDLTAYPLDLPPLPVQKRIAEILSTLDSAIEQTQALIEKGERIKEGLLHQLLTQGVSSNGSLRPSRDEAPHLYKETRLGWVPVGWETKELRMLADVSRGKFTVRPRSDPRFYGGEYPFIQTGDVALARGRILIDFDQTLNGKGLSVSKMFPAGTIMVTIAANIADTCILGVPMCAPDSLVGVTPKPGENARFIELSIRSKKRWLEGRAPQTAQRNINLEDLRPLLIASPDRAEQAAIAGRYEAADSSLASMERELVKLQLQKAGLMRDLLSGEVSVNGLTT